MLLKLSESVSAYKLDKFSIYVDEKSDLIGTEANALLVALDFFNLESFTRFLLLSLPCNQFIYSPTLVTYPTED